MYLLKRAFILLILLSIMLPIFSFEEKTTESTDNETSTLSIKTNIMYVKITCNGENFGYTPLVNKKLLPGRYFLVLSKKGYYDKEIVIDLPKGKTKELYIPLEEVTGTISFETSPYKTLKYVDNKLIDDDFIEVSEGTHNITVRLFGYENYTETVYVNAKQNTTVYVKLKKTNFKLTNFYVHPTAFNPANPGNTGTAEICYSITAPGKGTLQIQDATGNVIRAYSTGVFSTWDNFIRWDGRDNSGKQVKDGIYKAIFIISGYNVDGSIVPGVYETSITVNSSIFIPITGCNALGSGTGLISSGVLPPAFTTKISSTIEPIFDITNNKTSIPLFFTVVIPPLPWLEVSVRMGTLIQKDNVIPVLISSAIKSVFSLGPLYGGVLLQYGYSSMPLPQQYSEAGLSGTLLFGFKYGLFTLDVNSGVRYGRTQGLFTNEFSFEEGLSLTLQKNNFLCGLWGFYSYSELPFIQTGIVFSLLPNRTNYIILTDLNATFFESNKITIGLKIGFEVVY